MLTAESESADEQLLESDSHNEAHIALALSEVDAQPESSKDTDKQTVGSSLDFAFFLVDPITYTAPLPSEFSLSSKTVGGNGSTKCQRPAESKAVVKARKSLAEQRRGLSSKPRTKFRDMDRTPVWAENRILKVAHWMDLLCVDGKNSKTNTRIFSGDLVRSAMHMCKAAANAAQKTANSRDLQTGTPQLWAILLLQNAVARSSTRWTVRCEEAKVMFSFSTLEGIVAQYGGSHTSLKEPIPEKAAPKTTKRSYTARVLDSHRLGSGEALDAKIQCLDQLLRHSCPLGEGLHPHVMRLKPPAIIRLGKPGTLTNRQGRALMGHSTYGTGL